MRLNSTQKFVWRRIQQLRKAGIPPRIAVLKSRQVGISTLVEAILFWACLCNTNRSSLVIAHTLKSSRTLFRMSRNFYRNLPAHLRPVQRLESVHEIEFDTGSRMQIEVQGDPRGYAAQLVHISEFAFFTDPERTLVAVMQTLPGTRDSLAVIESTANGVGNKFHKLWQRAQGLAFDNTVPGDEKGWIPIFIPWFQHEEYQRAVRPGEIDPNAEELKLMRDNACTYRQIKWRRWCTSVNLDGDEDAFAVEYPHSDQAAFALSGRPAFDTGAVEFYTRVLSEAAQKNEIPAPSEIEADPPETGKIEVVPHSRGRLRIFALPRERHTYIVGADPSEGDPGSDHSPLAVLDQQTMDFVATWYGKAPPDVLATYAIMLARFYNEGLIINEANNHGILFHETVLQLGYPNLYFRKVSEDTVAGEITEKPGYLSTRRNREHLFNTLRKFVRMKMGKIPCPHLVQQMQGLVYIDGKADAQSGGEKDLLIAGALCLMAHRGSMANPLEPLPEETVRAVASEIELLRERDPDGAEKYSFDKTGMTMDQVLQIQDAMLERERRGRRYGVVGMR